MSNSLNILNHQDILIKIERLSCQIVENNLEASHLHIIGVKDRGLFLAEMIHSHISKFSDVPTTLSFVSVNKENALAHEIVFELSLNSFAGQYIILVDDVLNSGRVMSAIFSKLIEAKPEKIQIAVLANRNHRSFPIHADIVGIDLATTLKEHIHFHVDENNEMRVYLS